MLLPVGIRCRPQSPVSRDRLSEPVVIHQLAAGIVRRINVDHANPAGVGMPQTAQCIETVSLDVEIFGGADMRTFLRNIAKTHGIGGVHGFHRRTPPDKSQRKALRCASLFVHGILLCLVVFYSITQKSSTVKRA